MEKKYMVQTLSVLSGVFDWIVGMLSQTSSWNFVGSSHAFRPWIFEVSNMHGSGC